MTKTKKAKQQVQVIDIYLDLQEIDKDNYKVIVKDYFGGKYILGKLSRIAEHTWDFCERGEIVFRLTLEADFSILKEVFRCKLFHHYGKDSFK